MPRTESSSAMSQDYLDFYYPSSARALGPNVKMGQGHKLLGPTDHIVNNIRLTQNLTCDQEHKEHVI